MIFQEITGPGIFKKKILDFPGGVGTLFVNNDQSNLTKGGIALARPPNSSFVFARWQHRTDGLAAICKCMFWLGLDPKVPVPLGDGDPI